MKQSLNKFSLSVWLVLFFIAGLAPQYASAQTSSQLQAPAPLFAKDDLLKIRIEAPLKTLVSKAKRSKEPYPGALKLLDGRQTNYNITVAARGNSRRTGYCKFPPLRVKFDNHDQITGEFAGQKSLKLVTHCKDSDRYQQHMLLEYGIYQIYNQLTPHSLKTRLVSVEYVDTKSGDIIATRPGFFIEDMDDAANRNGMQEIDVPKIQKTQLNAEAAAKTVLFQYMIGNVDWSIRSGPKGSDCCHNTKLMGPTKTAASNIIATPYDFDSSGLVYAPYAEVSGDLPIKNVKERLYRGFCSQNAQVQAAFGEFVNKQSSIIGTFDKIPDLDEKYRKKAQKYLGEFFEAINNPKTVQRRIVSKCR